MNANPSLIAGEGFSLVDAIYAYKYEDLSDDGIYTGVMLRVLRDRYCSDNSEAPQPALILWLVEGHHAAALHLLLSHGLIDVDLMPTVHELLFQDAVLEKS